MVKKLYKHELASLFPWFALMSGIIIAAGVIARILFEVPTFHERLPELLSGMVAAFKTTAPGLCAVAVIAAFIVGFILLIVRFYNHMLSYQGYLTMSLPVTVSTHIWCKLLCALLLSLMLVVSTVIAGFILTIGYWKTEWVKAIAWFFSSAWQEFLLADLGTKLNIVLFAIEGLLAVIFAPISQMLYIYACLALGQLFGKNRIVGSVVFYFGLNFAVSILQSVGYVVVMFVGAMLSNMMTDEGGAMFIGHLTLGGAALLQIAISVACFLITKYMFQKRLNLE